MESPKREKPLAGQASMTRKIPVGGAVRINLGINNGMKSYGEKIHVVFLGN